MSIPDEAEGYDGLSDNAHYNPSNAAVATIEYALNCEDPLSFLRCWYNGEFTEIREWWSDTPESVFIGADPLHPGTIINIEGVDE